MVYINKITSSNTVDFAAEELRKYLYMMMPECDVEISYSPSAVDGFRLGIMSDFCIDTSHIPDTRADDAIHIDCDSDGGIIAGSNPRSVLLAVYEYLRQNGCRWLFPGVDGEYVPIKDVSAVKYTHVASNRFRGPCIEGYISQQILLETIEFLPKVGMNLFMSQFFVPTPFFHGYYDRKNSRIRAAEPVTSDIILGWKRAAEAEIAKRGLRFLDVGHGWAAAPFDIDCSSAWDAVDESIVPEESYKYLAEVNGRRGLYKSRVLTTQFCMSNTEAREKVIRYLVSYASRHKNADTISFALADNYNNHCECAECKKRTVSDWYVILLNEADEALTAAGLDTHITFCVYTETTWPPMTERIKNPSRFTLELAPITRSYTVSMTDTPVKTVPFTHNSITMPKTLDEYMEYFKLWGDAFPGDALAFEYHFWKHQVFDVSGLELARRIYEDVEAYRARGVSGLIACGSQRAYFPNGFAYYVFARKLYDDGVSLEYLTEDYYSHAYGDSWRDFYGYLKSLESAISFAYLEAECSADESVSPYYNPEIAERIKSVSDIVAKGRELISRFYNSDRRVSTVSVRVLEEHAGYVERLAELLYHKAMGDDEAALRASEPVLEYISAREPFIERYMDMNMTAGYIKEILYAKGVKKVSVLNN